MKKYNHELMPDRLRKIRKEMEMSQYEFATLANVREKSYWQYEKGNSMPPLDKLCALMNAHKLTFDELFLED
jgi:transcriptional regulator with XRE-family HTH domain